MTHAVSAILRNVDSTSSIDDIFKNLGRLREIVAGTEDPMGDGGPGPGGGDAAPAASETAPAPVVPAEALQTLALIESQLQALQSQYDYVEARLTRFENEADERLFEGIERVLERAVVDFQTAFDATRQYTLEWFADALISDAAKPELAAMVLAQVKRYCPSNLKTLELIAARDPDTMRRLQAPSIQA